MVCDGFIAVDTSRLSGERGCPGHFVPNPEPFTTDFSIISGGEQVASGTEVRSNYSVYLDKPLGVPSRLEPSHSLLPLARRLMRVLRAIVQVAMLPMSHAGHHHPFRHPVAAQFVRDDDARLSSCSPQQLTKEPDRAEP